MSLEAFVYIIESPGEFDLLDGRTEGRALCSALELCGIRHEYSLVTSLDTLKHALSNRLVACCEQQRVPPILHLSMHGDKECVALTDKSTLRWNALRNELEPFSETMNGGLLICMSSCFGGSGCRMAMHEKGAKTYWALVGNSGDVEWSDAVVAYVAFYHNFFKEKSIEECVEAMKHASSNPKFLCHYGSQIAKDWKTFIAQQKRQDLLQHLIASLGVEGVKS